MGALDGKHIVIKPPLKSGSEYYNYKGTHSIVLMALVDADYKFLFVDVGTNGRISDGGVFEKTALAAMLENKTLHLPDNKPLPGRTTPQPFVIVADEAFPLKPYIMKPYSARSLNCKERRVYNYRLSRSRRVVENAFGILANRFRVFLTKILLKPRRAEQITLAACALHNFLRVQSQSSFDSMLDKDNDTTGSITPGSWRSTDSNGSWKSLTPHPSSHRCTDYAADVREEFCAFFNNEGSVPWQDGMLRDY